MTLQPHDFNELRSLLDALCEDTIAPEQVQRLEELVLGHPDAEAYYVQYMALYADLDRHFRVPAVAAERSLLDRLGAGSPTQEQSQPAARWRRLLSPWRLVPVAAVAAALLIAMMLLKRPGGVRGPVGLGPEPVDDTVAVLLQVRQAEWEDTGLPTRPGAPLRPGVLRLKAGFAQLEFYNGATVILEGPAEFKLVSRTEGYCVRGKLRATVPPQAHGFRIGSPKLNLVDLGTEFGLEVGAGDHTEVHVFQGKVELHETARQEAPQRELTTGQGVRVDDRGELLAIKPRPGAFLTAQELARRSQADMRRRQSDWLKASEARRRDPSLLVYYTFEAEPAWSRTLTDRAPGRPGRDGAIVGCTWVPGRWPGREGLQFKRVSDRVRLNVPGEFESVTLAAWVRVDALPNRNNSLLMADGWPEGGLHWQLGEDGTLILGVQSRPRGRGAHYHAPAAITPARFGQWLQLAVVYDQNAGMVTHYVDGQAVVQSVIEFDIPLRVGNAELGNWNIASHRNNTPVRFLSGCVDEFLFFSRALAEGEIAELYEQGRPPS